MLPGEWHLLGKEEDDEWLLCLSLPPPIQVVHNSLFFPLLPTLPRSQEAMWSCAFGEKYFLTMTKRLSAAYQRAMQTPGAFKGKVHVVQVPMAVDMTRN